MENFRQELFKDPTNYEEVPLRDRKVDFPNLQRRTGHPEKKAEFIRDVIALANTARLWGKPAYLLFGIDDSGGVAGICDYLTVYRRSDEREPFQLQEAARKQIKSILEDYVKPIMPKFEVRFGQVDGHLVAYLILEPLLTPEPFQVAKSFGKGIKSPLKEADCWIRIGESKKKICTRQISPTEDPYCYAHSHVPYLLPSQWERYFTKILDDSNKNGAPAISNYLELVTERGEGLMSVVQSFLVSDEQRLLLIRGAAGSGKTTFLERLIHKYASDGKVSIEGIRHCEEFVPPSDWIPIFVQLRHRNESVKSVEQFAAFLMKKIGQRGQFWEQLPKQPEKLFELDKVRWLLFLDGFDELEENGQKRVVATISEFVLRYPRIRVLLTSRPETIQADWEGMVGAATATVRPLTDHEIRDFLLTYNGRNQSASTAREVTALEKARAEALDFVNAHPDIRKLCSYPSYLVATIREIFPSGDDAPSDQPESVRPNRSDGPSVESDTERESEKEFLFSPPLTGDELRLEEPVTDEGSDVEGSDVEAPDEEDEDVGRGIQTGIILNNIYRYLWGREVERWSILQLDSAEKWEATGNLALRTHDRIRFPRAEAQKSLRSLPHWLLTLGICQSAATMPINLQFVTELTKAFFAASMLASWVEGGEYESAKQNLQECTEEFSQQMLDLLVSLTPHDLSKFSQEEQEWRQCQNQL